MHSPDPITRHVGRHAHCLRVNIALKLLPSESKPAIFDAACCLTFWVFASVVTVIGMQLIVSWSGSI